MINLFEYKLDGIIIKSLKAGSLDFQRYELQNVICYAILFNRMSHSVNKNYDA